MEKQPQDGQSPPEVIEQGQKPPVDPALSETAPKPHVENPLAFDDPDYYPTRRGGGNPYEY